MDEKLIECLKYIQNVCEEHAPYCGRCPLGWINCDYGDDCRLQTQDPRNWIIKDPKNDVWRAFEP